MTLDVTNGWYVDVGNHEKVPPKSVAFGPFQSQGEAVEWAASRKYNDDRVWKREPGVSDGPGIPLGA